MIIIVDGMLGKVAKWLRLIGLNVFYKPEINDDELLEITKNKQGILITADEELSYKAFKNEIKVIYLKNRNKIEIIQEIIKKLNINVNELNIGSRCLICNNLLIQVNKEKVIGHLPKRVVEKNEEFWYCKNCKKIYWYGSHWKNIKKELKSLGLKIVY